MKLQALRFLNSPAPDSPIKIDHTELDLNNIHSLHASSSMIVPSAYLIRTDDLKHLRSLGDLIVDRGQKHAAKQLAKLLLGYPPKIPIIAGGFTAPGSLKKSIGKFLEHASQAERNAYIIGTNPEVFSQLWREAERMKEEKNKVPEYSKTDSDSGEDGFKIPDILTMLSSVNVPDDLKKEYVGDTDEIELVRKLIMRAAAVDHPVLILGDHGTGKEKVARAIHKYSSRGQKTIVTINCGAISPYLLEAELFGIEGKDTNFPAKQGLWELANNGTLFLDEIGDILLEHQVKILRALQEGVIRPVGGTNEIKVNARIITATNRPLLSMTREGKFREDLYHRLYYIVIHTPPLRNHPNDIPRLAQDFWEHITGEKKPLPIEIIKELMKMHWPGNVRQLKAILIALHSHFGKENIKARHLRAVFYLHDLATQPLKEKSSLEESLRRQIETLSHLRRVEEVIRAFETTVDPILKARNIDAETVQSLKTAIQYRQDELEVLSRPGLFSSPSTFSVVHLLKGKFLYFQDLLQKNTEKAFQYWKTDVGSEIRQALSSISKEIGQITKSI